MDTPGYDPVSATGQVAGGANVIVLHHRARLVLRLQAGAEPQARHQHADVPTTWPRTWTSTAARSPTASAASSEMGERIFELMLDTASGKQSKSEELGFGDDEFAPWQLGAVM